MSTLVSVVIPAWNREAYIADAIGSVLDQRLDAPCSLEIIVADDGSTDRTREVAQACSPAVKVVSQPNAGISAARNLGMRHARGEVFAFLDSDDLWHPEKVRVQLAHLEARPEVSAVFSRECGFHGNRSRREVLAAPVDPESVRAAPNASSFLGRIAVWRDAGPFRESQRMGEFVEWFSRAMNTGIRWTILEDALVFRRAHDSNISKVKIGDRTDYFSTLRQHLSMKRERVGE